MRVAAGIADDNDIVIKIACCVDRGSNADIDGAAGNNNRVDSTCPQRQIEIGLMEGAPTIFWNNGVFRSRRDFFDYFLLPGAFSGSVNRWIALIAGPGPKAHI